jgi:hypothetical protein
VFEEEELRRMTAHERQLLRRRLAALDQPQPGGDRGGERRRKYQLIFIICCCIVLAAWIGVLAVTLPRYYRAGGWRGAWVGFDVAELAAFAATGWAAWRRRQVLIVCLVVLATLLCCDAWFDVVLDSRTSGFWVSLASALLIELPLAAVAIVGARRLLRRSFAVMRIHQGAEGPLPRLREIPLVGLPDHALTDLLTAEDEMPGHAAGSAD